ncbi:glycosyltransferase [Castellaniella daejeonensis]|jgi:glycosyltransferase involved in cell wall biosynthesis|uniref:Glycosyltransferase n=1 Tax=Castellaniella daejeonensis TaxID=659013 RepID=A0ABN0TC54_9BURK
MAEHKKTRFSVVTATYNAAAVLPRLIMSLKAQTDQDFEWVVADGASADGTLAMLEEAGKTLSIRVDSRPDFGIYDALNRAVKLATGDYYLVVGADDELFPDAVKNYKNACDITDADMVTALIEVNGRVGGVRSRQWEWLYGQFAHVSGHAVGLAIRRSLHDRFGWYSRKLPIAADQLFILKAVHGGSEISRQDFLAGKFRTEGTSGNDTVGTLVEGFRSQVLVGHNVWLQLLILCLRLFKNRRFLGSKG